MVLLGDPVDHSRSPDIHQAAFRAAGIEGSYSVRKVDQAGLLAALDEVRAGALDGANVTMPHKQAAARAADRREEAVERIGAANTLVRDSGRVVAHNTDVDGVGWAWDRAGLPDGPVLVLGSGGAAAAAVWALRHRSLSLSARREERAAAMLDRLGLEAGLVPWGEPLSGAVVVNATSLGMEGEALPAGILERSAGLLDMPYRTDPTPSVQRSRALGLPTAEGLDLLVGQAARAFEAWTGRPAPVEAMRAALGR